MTQSVAVSTRSFLIAGMSAAVVGAAVVSPTAVPALSTRLAATPVGLAAVTTPIEAAIKNAYNAIEPWAAYGADLGQYVLGFIPGLWWIAPGIDLAYYTIEPLVQAGVYSVADLLGGNFEQIGPDINTGITTSVNNAINYALAWLSSLVPLPPLPPLPPFPGASVPAAAAIEPALLATASTDVPAGPGARSITTPIEVAIKNTYNAVEPWAAYAAAWGQYVLSVIPGLWWLAPGVSFGYYTIEPLVQAGVYSFADVIGLNFAQIGPDVVSGINASVNNAINYGLAWINALVPLPPIPPIPPLPGASVAAGAASARAAAPLGAPEAEAPEVGAPEAGSKTAASTSRAEAPSTGGDAPTVESAAQAATEPDAPAVQTPAPVDAPAADETAAPVETPAVDEVPAAVVDEVPVAGTPASGPGAPTAAADDSAVSVQKPHRPSRAGRAAG